MIPRLRFCLEGGGNGFNQDAYNLLRLLARDFIMYSLQFLLLCTILDFVVTGPWKIIIYKQPSF